MRKIFAAAIVVSLVAALFFSFFPLPAWAETDISNTANASQETPTDPLNEGEGGKEGGGGSGGLSGLIQKWLDALAALPKAIVDKMLESVLETWGAMTDSFLESACGVLDGAFLKTQYPGHIAWVAKWNVTMWLMCLPVYILFLVLAVLKILHGKRQAAPVLTSFAVGVFFTVFSVQVVNTLVWAANTVSDGMVKTALDAFSGGPRIDTGTVTAMQIISMPFQDPATFGTQIPFHSLFFAPSGSGAAQYAHGGAVGMVFAAAGWVIMSLLAGARAVVLCLATVLAPVYVSLTVLSSRIEPAVGWVAFICRTVFVQVLWVLAWQLMVLVQVQFSKGGSEQLFGSSAVMTNTCILYAVAYASFRFWLKPTVGQIMQPVTLAGGHIIEKTGQMGEKLGQAVSLVGMATYRPEVVAAGQKVSSAGKAVAGQGKELHGGRKAADAMDLSMPAPVEGKGIMKNWLKKDAENIQKNYHDFLDLQEKAREDARKRAEEEKRQRYWTLGEKYIVLNDHGLPVEVPVPPPGYRHMGEWGE